jgi:hypothetical protein
MVRQGWTKLVSMRVRARVFVGAAWRGVLSTRRAAALETFRSSGTAAFSAFGTSAATRHPSHRVDKTDLGDVVYH